MGRVKAFLHALAAVLAAASLIAAMSFRTAPPKANSCDLEVRKINGKLEGRCRVGATCSLPMTCDPGVDSSLWSGWELQFCMCDIGSGEPATSFQCYPGGFECITMIARKGEEERVVCYDCACADSPFDRGLEQEPDDCTKSDADAYWSTLCVCPAEPGE